MRCIYSSFEQTQMCWEGFGRCQDRLLATALKDMTCFFLCNPLPRSVLKSKVLWKWCNMVQSSHGIVSSLGPMAPHPKEQKDVCLSVQLQLASMVHVQSTRLIQCRRAFLHFLKRLIRMHPCLAKGKLTSCIQSLGNIHITRRKNCCGGTWPTAKITWFGNCQITPLALPDLQSFFRWRASCVAFNFPPLWVKSSPHAIHAIHVPHGISWAPQTPSSGPLLALHIDEFFRPYEAGWLWAMGIGYPWWVGDPWDPFRWPLGRSWRVSDFFSSTKSSFQERKHLPRDVSHQRLETVLINQYFNSEVFVWASASSWIKLCQCHCHGAIWHRKSRSLRCLALYLTPCDMVYSCVPRLNVTRSNVDLI